MARCLPVALLLLLRALHVCQGVSATSKGWEFSLDRTDVPVIASAVGGSTPASGQVASPDPPIASRPPAEPENGAPGMPELLGTCTTSALDGYEYTLCPYANITQRDAVANWNTFWGVLGVYEGWEVDAEIDPAHNEGGSGGGGGKVYLHQHYTDGTPCGDTPRRAAVLWECGEEAAIVGVSEPTTCHYAVTFQTPVACGDPRIRGAGEAASQPTALEAPLTATGKELRALRCGLTRLAALSGAKPDSTPGTDAVLAAALQVVAAEVDEKLREMGVPAAEPVQGGGGDGGLDSDSVTAEFAALKESLAAAKTGKRVDAVRFLELASRVQAALEGGEVHAANVRAQQASMMAGHAALQQQQLTCEAVLRGSESSDASPLQRAAVALHEAVLLLESA